jgi:hypothetical protein
VSLLRTRYHAPRAGSATPVDALLDAAAATVSRGARELCCMLNASAGGFAKAADNLERAAQVSISAESLRGVVESEGRRALRASDSGALGPGWKAADCKVRTPGGAEVSRAYLGADGFMAPVLTDAEKAARRKAVVAARRVRGRGRGRGKPAKPKPPPPLRPRKRGADRRYKEFKLVQFHDESMGRRLVSVTRKDCNEAGRLMRRDAGRVGFHAAGERVGVADGAAWIARAVERFGVPLTALGLDFYHLASHVHEGGRATFGEAGEGGRAGSAWAGGVLHAVKHQGYAPFWDGLVRWRAGLRSKPKREAADGLLHYASAHQGMIHYDEFRARGWRIGSGPTESQCRSVPHRVKGPGKRWDADNAEAVMALECLDQSNQWDAYWSTCARQNS